jgi:hypothetical protein
MGWERRSAVAGRRARQLVEWNLGAQSFSPPLFVGGDILYTDGNDNPVRTYGYVRITDQRSARGEGTITHPAGRQ